MQEHRKAIYSIECAAHIILQKCCFDGFYFPWTPFCSSNGSDTVQNSVLKWILFSGFKQLLAISKEKQNKILDWLLFYMVPVEALKNNILMFAVINITYLFVWWSLFGLMIDFPAAAAVWATWLNLVLPSNRHSLNSNMTIIRLTTDTLLGSHISLNALKWSIFLHFNQAY